VCETHGIESVRIDQWLWSVRLTKTRSEAAAACRSGHVKINDKPAKPSSAVKVGDRIVARLAQRERIADVSQVITKRVGAALAAECFEDHSPADPERLRAEPVFAARERGAGRPTKRDRRKLDEFRGRD
jgi:ribosome-associated heat shock protein Hsp15